MPDSTRTTLNMHGESDSATFMGVPKLAVSFQQVVHSALTEEADVIETSGFQGGPNGHPQECSFDAA